MKKTTTSSYLALCYADIFDYPLNEEELVRWGISNKGIKVLRYKGIKEKEGFFCLRGREKIIKLRKVRSNASQKKLLIAKKISQVLRKCSFVKMVAVTGALAMENSDKNDDIDLLVVTEKNRVWLTRFLTTLTLDILGQRRKRNDEVFSDKICLNMFLDETKLLIPLKEQNLYTAHEICQVKPLYSKSQTYEKFMFTNSWAKKYLPKAFNKGIRVSGYQGIKGKNIFDYFLDLLEFVAFKLQYFYMQKHITRETVTTNRIMFHPKDTNKMVLEEFKKRIEN